MDIAHYFDNPEELNKETLYELRNLIALYPFYQPARILLLKNLFLSVFLLLQTAMSPLGFSPDVVDNVLPPPD